MSVNIENAIQEKTLYVTPVTSGNKMMPIPVNIKVCGDEKVTKI